MIAVIILAVFVSIAFFISYLNARDDGDERAKKSSLRWLKTLLAIVIACWIGLVFTPTTKEMLLIYGVGGTVDYIKTNDTAKQLPDKVVNALDKYLDSLDNNKDDE
jgi:NADH:ubiquinone oxidoreductase subunit 6 (subunit J)